MEVLGVACSHRPGSGSPALPGVNEASERFRAIAAFWGAAFTPLRGDAATRLNVSKWVISRKQRKVKLAIHFACHGLTSGALELRDGDLSLVLLAAELGRGEGNLIVGDCCFGGHKSGRCLHGIGGDGTQSSFPAPPRLVGDILSVEPVEQHPQVPRVEYNPDDAIVFTASQHTQVAWYAALKEDGTSDNTAEWCGVFTAYFCHTLRNHPHSNLGEHWQNICLYISEAGNLWLQDAEGGQMDPYLHWRHENIHFP